MKKRDIDKKRDWAVYPVRQCNSLHFCNLCRNNINGGEFYRDGGYGIRAHVKCVLELGKENG